MRRSPPTSTSGLRAQPRPVRNHAEAARLISAALHVPLEHETFAVLLDRSGRGVGGTIVNVTGTVDADALLQVAEVMCSAAGRHEPPLRLLLATVRPVEGLLPGDIDRWLEASQLAEGHGLQLVEWYVVHRGGMSRPRELLGEPPRW